METLRRLATDCSAPEDLLYRLSDPKLTAGLEHHQHLLKQWNPKINLTRVIDDESSAKKHFLESLLAGTLISDSESKVADLGSGAGFPGIPVGMLWPELKITLLESDIRKSIFLKEVSRGFPNIRVESLRGDAFGNRSPRPDIQLVISRAVMWADLSRLAITLACPLIWITSEAEFEKSDTRMFHVERRVELPDSAGIAVRMFHVERQVEVLR